MGVQDFPEKIFSEGFFSGRSALLDAELRSTVGFSALVDKIGRSDARSSCSFLGSRRLVMPFHVMGAV